MKKTIRLPRILKIEAVRGFEVYCIFNNGETRVIDFQKVFKNWKISRLDPAYRLRKEDAFKKVRLRNHTLSWPNVGVELEDPKGKKVMHPYEIGADTLYEVSVLLETGKNRFVFGSIIKRTRLEKGLSQQELADRSGTSKTYISRIENDLIEPELSTLYKIVEIGLGKKIIVDIR